ncbi:MAG: hypothetical protein M1831_003928 [Alyxoria varia]|nr:MAG: hypothetical protein M1831_003928 [Alyxoria varia]
MANQGPPPQATLNIPAVLVTAALAVFAIRYFFFSPSPDASSNTAPGVAAAASSSSRNSRRRVAPEKIETVLSMFPQLSRRNIEWDLQRNGSSVQTTSERVLTEGRLPEAPSYFRASTPPLTSSSQAAPRNAPRSSQHPDLITRYNLSNKLSEPYSRPSQSSKGKQPDPPLNQLPGEEPILTNEAQQAKGGWSSNKNERAELLKKRREEMILQARKRMEEGDKKGKEKA